MVSGIMALQTLPFGSPEPVIVPLDGKRDFADVIKGRTLRWGDEPGSSLKWRKGPEANEQYRKPPETGKGKKTESLNSESPEGTGPANTLILAQ